MPGIHHDLHGSAPDQSDFALLLIDVINDFDFPEGRQLLETAVPAARRIRELKQRARSAGVPIIYVNDNFGRWRSNFTAHVELRGRQRRSLSRIKRKIVRLADVSITSS